MSNNDSIEVEAASVEEAAAEALQQLGAREDEVAIEVIATPRAGMLGLGARNARVRVTRKPPGATNAPSGTDAAEVAPALNPQAPAPSRKQGPPQGRSRGRENRRRGRNDGAGG